MTLLLVHTHTQTFGLSRTVVAHTNLIKACTQESSFISENVFMDSVTYTLKCENLYKQL